MKWFLVLSVTILFLISIAFAAGALDTMIKGKVVAVDPLKQVLIISQPNPEPLAIGGSRQYTFTLGEMTYIRMCNQYKTIGDVKVGDDVTVGYHEKAGRMYADVINIPTPLVACLFNEP